MADARGKASKIASLDMGSASTRPARLRVMRPEVQEVLKSPRRSRPKKQPPPPPPLPPPPLPPSPPPPPPRKEKKNKKKEKEKKQKKEEKEKKEEEEEEEKEKEKKKVEEEEEEVERPRYHCAFQEEGEQGTRDFAPPDMVWGKVRSHSWWPGQVFDAADASEAALKHRKAGAPLIAYFWDRTFAWSDGSALLPFRANFARLSAQSTMSAFVSAVDAALQETGRRVEAGLSCDCFGGSGIATKQEVQNSGIRQGAYGAAVDAAYMRDAFGGKAFLDYIAALGRNPLAGADLLDLATAKAQLRAFNRSRGSRDLPEFVVLEGIDDEVILDTKRKRTHKSSEEDDVPSKEKKPRRAGSSSRRKETLPEVTNEEAMDEKPSRGATDDTVSKGNKSKGAKSSANKKIVTSKISDGPETPGVGDSKTPAKKKTVDGVLNESKSGRALRSTRKQEDALEGLKRLGKADSDGNLTGKNKDSTLLKENKLSRRTSSARKKDKITEDEDGLGDGSAKDSASPAKRREVIPEDGWKEKKLSELMAETGKPNSRPGGQSKTRRKRSLHESTEKPEDPDRDSKDTAKTGKTKKLHTLGDLSSQPQHLSRKKSTKVGELTSKTAGRMSQTPPVVKGNGAVPQIRLREDKHRQLKAANKPQQSAKVNRSKKDAPTEASPSCDEVLSELSLAARGLKKKEKVAPTNVSFLTDFRKNSYASSSDADKDVPEEAAGAESIPSEEVPEKAANTSEEIPEKAAKTESTPSEEEEVPEKAANTESTPPEQPIADHMQDDYWADILINVEEPLSSLKKKKDESKKRTSKKEHQAKKISNNSSVIVQSADEARDAGKQDTENGEQLKSESKPFAANGSQENTGTKSTEEMENSLLAGLVMHFSRPNAVPSRSDLIKIFSQYGPVNEAKAEVANNANSAQVIFKRRMDAEAAFAGAGKISALGPALVSFRLSDFPDAASGNEPSHGA